MYFVLNCNNIPVFLVSIRDSKLLNGSVISHKQKNRDVEGKRSLTCVADRQDGRAFAQVRQSDHCLQCSLIQSLKLVFIYFFFHTQQQGNSHTEQNKLLFCSETHYTHAYALTQISFHSLI